jgi:uncharacterized repeat protein (TIGR03803 family)
MSHAGGVEYFCSTGVTMTKPMQNRGWIFGIRLRAAAGLGLTILLIGAAVGTPLAEAQAFSVLHKFRGADGENPIGGLVGDGKGHLYGTTFNGGALSYGAVFTINTTGKENVFHSFNRTDGQFPYAELVRDAKGNFYGTTYGGGAHTYGVVFKLNKFAKETVLHAFTGGADGKWPQARLIVDAKGNLYGTTVNGGAFGSGVVFKVDGTGKETVLHSFSGKTDGSSPLAGVTMDDKGNLYGTTYTGGGIGCYPYGCGVVFEIDHTGKETVLHAFTGGKDGAAPLAGLIRDVKGNLYGTTAGGGDLNCAPPGGCGTVFRMDKTGKETVLYNFTGKDGAGPWAPVIMDAAGDLYGTTWGGGPAGLQYGSGVVFKVDKTGKETVLHSFSGKDGKNPYAGLVRDAAGNLYGTTEYGGKLCNFGCGVVFKITP